MNTSSLSSHNRRRFQRIQFACTAELQDEYGHYQCSLQDISLKGVLLGQSSNCVCQVGARMQLCLCSDDGLTINMEVRVVYVGESSIGCCWEHIDIDGFSQLKRLMEVNIGDGDLILRELSELSSEE